MGSNEESERLRTKHLLAELERNGQRSRYADVLRRPQNSAQALASLEAEFLSEMAASLGRAEERLCRALVEAEALALELDRATPAHARRETVVEKYNEACDEARRRLDVLRMQREACGFHRNDILDEMYPIPKRRPS